MASANDGTTEEPAETNSDSARWARILSVALAVVCVAVLGGLALRRVVHRIDEPPVATAADPAPGPGPTDDIVLLGDSITEQSDHTFRQQLPSDYRLRIQGRGGYRIEEMEPYADELASTNPEQVVINLGSNDVLLNWPIESSVAAYNRLLDTFHSVRCVHLVTVGERFYSDKVPNLHEHGIALNEELRKLAKARGYDVIDWAGAVNADVAAGEPKGPLTTDTVHPTPEGERRLSELYRTALDNCGK